MRPTFLLFFGVVLAVLTAANLYTVRRAARAFSFSRRTRRILLLVLAPSALAAVGGRLVERAWPNAPVASITAVGATIQLAVLVSVALLLVAHLGEALVGLAARVRRGMTRSAVPGASVLEEDAPTLARAPNAASGAHPVARDTSGVPRRSFLHQAAAGSAFLIGSSSSLYGALAGRHDYTIEDVPVKIPGLARAMDGYVIVQLSDVHIGQFVGDAELAAAEELVRHARPDLVVLTGDLLDHDARLAPRLGQFARRLRPLARDGVVAISGNHDFFAGIQPFVAALEAGGATVLRNRGMLIGEPGAGISLLGVDDVWAARRGGRGPDLSRALQSLPLVGGRVAPALDQPRVLLCHNPVFFEQAAGEVTLQLSGHTHGGQINPVVRPADWVLKNGWVAGMYERAGSRMYINRGFGTVGPPARIGAPPEITRLILVS